MGQQEAGVAPGKFLSTGHGDMKTTIRWADAELIDVQLNYDLAIISIRDSTGYVRRVRLEGYIRFEYSGVWDELVIVTAQISELDDFSRTAWEAISARYSGSPPSSGSPARNSAKTWHTLTIVFSDGATLRCVAASVVEE